jgi:tetratricopeptide (TPR) repeat protein
MIENVRRDDVPPSRSDVEYELALILNSKRFAIATKQAEFLALIVRRKLDGKQSPENEIGPLLFTKFRKEESLNVRVTAKNLRKALAGYYAHEGKEDLVFIEIPTPLPDRRVKFLPGEAYTPRFSYNPAHEAARLYKLGSHFVERAYAPDVGHAGEYFAKVLEIVPNHLGAHVSMAELHLLNFWSARSSPLYDPSRLPEAEEWLKKAYVLGSEWWRFWAATGLFFLRQNELVPAESAFAKAFALDPTMTVGYSGFILFLTTAGRSSEALEILRLYVRDHPDELNTLLFYATLLRSDGHISEAEAVFKHALELDSANPFTALYLAALHRFQGSESEAAKYLKRAQLYLDKDTIEHSFGPID